MEQASQVSYQADGGPGIKRVSHLHDQIMDWLIANPALPLSHCAIAFNRTQPWLSTIIHSDCFQARLRERQDGVFGEVALSVKDRITALAHDSLERLGQIIETTKDERLVLDSAETALKAMGFAPAKNLPSGNVYNFQQNTVIAGTVSKETLANARALMDQAHAVAQVPPTPPLLEGPPTGQT
jgi:hypothetical protein